MGSEDAKNTFAERFFSRTRKRELSTKPGETGIPNWMRQLGRTVGVFIIAPLITLIVLWILEMPFTDKSIDALYSVLLRTDVIFLAFSLALTVILEWTITSNNKGAPTFFVVVEGILGVVSLIFYVVEEFLKQLSNHNVKDFETNALMMNRELIHATLLLAVVFVAVVGYFSRIRHDYKTQHIGEVNND